MIEKQVIVRLEEIIKTSASVCEYICSFHKNDNHRLCWTSTNCGAVWFRLIILVRNLILCVCSYGLKGLKIWLGMKH